MHKISDKYPLLQQSNCQTLSSKNSSGIHTSHPINTWEKEKTSNLCLVNKISTLKDNPVYLNYFYHYKCFLKNNRACTTMFLTDNFDNFEHIELLFRQ